MLDLIKPPSIDEFKEVYCASLLYAIAGINVNRDTVIQELMQTDLHQVIRTQHLSADHCQACVASLATLAVC